MPIKNVRGLKLRDKVERILLEQAEQQPYWTNDSILRTLFWAIEHEDSWFRLVEVKGWISNTSDSEANHGFYGSLLKLKWLRVLDWKLKGGRGRQGIHLKISFTESFKSFVSQKYRKWNKWTVCQAVMEWEWPLRILVQLIKESVDGQIEIRLPLSPNGGFTGRFKKKRVDPVKFWHFRILGCLPGFNPVIYRMLWQSLEGFGQLPFPARNILVGKMLEIFGNDTVYLFEKWLDTRKKLFLRKISGKLRILKLLGQNVEKYSKIRLLNWNNYTYILTCRKISDWLCSCVHLLQDLVTWMNRKDSILSLGFLIWKFSRALGIDTTARDNFTFNRPWNLFFKEWIRYPKGRIWLKQLYATF